MVGTVAVVLIFQNSTRIGNAYGEPARGKALRGISYGSQYPNVHVRVRGMCGRAVGAPVRGVGNGYYWVAAVCRPTLLK